VKDLQELMTGPIRDKLAAKVPYLAEFQAHNLEVFTALSADFMKSYTDIGKF
jgi:hypothetical protein